MNLFPRALVLYACFSSVVFTFLVLIGCGFNVGSAFQLVCNLNDFFIKEALDVRIATFWIVFCLLPGLFIVIISNCLACRDKKGLVKSRKLVANNVFLKFSNVKLRNVEVWGRWVYAVVFLFWLMDFLIAKAGSAITGVALGVVLYLHFFFEQNYSLVIGCLVVAYGVSVFPNYIYWRFTR